MPGAGCPIVVMDRDLRSQYISSITIDNRKSAYEVGRYIHEKGFRTVGCIVGEGPDGVRREEGFRAAVRDFGLILRQEHILAGDFIYETARVDQRGGQYP